MNALPLASALAILLGSALLSSCLHDPVAQKRREKREAFDHLTRGQDLLREGDYILARDTFLRGIEVSDRPVLQYHVAHAYYQLGQYEQSLPWYDRAIDMASDYQLAMTERELARVQHARRLQEPAPTEPLEAGEPAAEPLDDTVSTPPPTHHRTERLPEVGRVIGVITGAEQAGMAELPEGVTLEEVRNRIFPELVEGIEADLPALRTAAREAARGGRMDDASRLWIRILNIDSLDMEARLGLAQAYLRTGRTRAAGEEYERAQRIFPRQAQVQFEWGNFFVEQGDFDQARARFQRATELDAEHYRAWNNKGVSLLRLDRPAEALPCFQEATRLSPEFSPSWLNKAIAKDELGHPDSEILADLERYMRLREVADPSTERWIRNLRRSGADTPATTTR